MYKNNSGFSEKLNVSALKKSHCLTKKLAIQNPLLLLYPIVVPNYPNKNFLLKFN